MTGAVIGTGTMWAAAEPISGSVGAFTWATDAERRVFMIDKFLDTARAVMARRKLDLPAAHEEALTRLWNETAK